MLKKLTREELINLVNRIVECEGSEEEIDEMIEVVKRNVPHPEISDLIYWNEEELTPEQIVDKALEYKRIQL
ncbi:MAG: bacteriocin immunity protein [Clostridium argentinense]|uniref:Bacteriocin immunity protein n=1 Tax=Clostridium faecium TaxID=2762223 RepID=A0ABR8YR06_9CLOT|nr:MULTISPECIES: bacteriocin immunity protein [Clostridium]MBD8046670.1 bacteriocin immunity protein [Clostridium faecium]MBS5825028.1 bacteriocin immunity protein [Clostridium argentinense]MDU1350090.1 bacteriocin immunity protein [Clostridium argentinense]